MTLELPYPPTVNNYWRRKGRQYFIAPRGLEFRQSVVLIALSERVRTIKGPVEVEVMLYPPDRLRRDLDNCCKALLDALEHAGVYESDHLIRRLLLEWGPVERGGRTLVKVGPFHGRV